MSLADHVLGRPLASHEEEGQKVGPLTGVPMLGLDALSSAAYGPEATLTLLLLLGVLGLAYVGPITLLILALLTILYFSYRQTIVAYPTGGGSYTVAKENLGTSAGLLAAASLLLDYVLNVAVGIAAGVGALVSALPVLHSHILALCLVILAAVAFLNLRGVREAGVAFILPTYLFVGCLGLTVIIGCVRVVLSHGHPVAVETPPAMPAATAGVTLWLLLRSFSSGCTARLFPPDGCQRNSSPIVVLPIKDWNTITENALRFALDLSPDVYAVHIGTDQTEADAISTRWTCYVEPPIRAAGLPMPQLVTLSSPYRRLFTPFLNYVEHVKAQNPARTIAVIIPELVETHWYQYLLHNQRATGLKAALLLRGDSRVVVINVPWYLSDGGARP